MSFILDQLNALERPETAGGAWADYMRAGNFAAAWAVSDAVLRARRGIDCSRWPRHEQFVWNGTPLTGKRVLIRCYHGLGDTVQFIRYATLVRSVAREVLVWAQPQLLPLLRYARGIDRLLLLHDGTPEAEYEVDVEIMELPHVFRSTLDNLPRDVPYLHLPAPPARRKARRLEVGLVWQGGDWDPRRDVPLSLLTALSSVHGVRLHALQIGPALSQWGGGPDTMLGTTDPLQTARAMQTLDLVITIDSFPAHLAGALGIPVWTLLHARADWRWMNDRTDSPWYPTMRLFRQTRAGDWEAPLAEVRLELARLAGEAVRLRG